MIARLVVLAAALILPALAQDPTAPSLLFNWTLRPVDAPLELRSDWLLSASDPTTARRADTAAVVRVEYIGSGIAFLGSMSDYASTGSDGLPERAATVYVNGDPTWSDTDPEKYIMGPASDTVLWQRLAPRFQEYSASLQAFVGNWTLKGADIMTGMNSTAASLHDVPIRVEKFVGDDGKLNPFYNTTGRWEVTPASGDIPTFAKCYDDAIARVDIPAGTAYLVINGTRSSNSRTLYLQFQNEAATGYESSVTVDALFPFTTEAVLYIRPIRTDRKYTLVLSCVLSGQGEQGLTSMTFYEGSGGGKSSSTNGSNSNGSSTNGSSTTGSSNGSSANGSNGNNNSGSGSGSNLTSKLGTGAIVGIIIAVAAVVLIALLLWWGCSRRRNKNHVLPPPPAPYGGIPQYTSGDVGGEIDPNVYPTAYSYQPPAQPTFYDKPGGNPNNVPPPSYGGSYKGH